MKKLGFLLALLLTAPSAFATTSISEMTTGGALTGPEQFPFIIPGNTTAFKGSANQIATFVNQSLPTVPVTGIKCDGAIVPMGVLYTTGSPIVTLQGIVGGTLTYPQTFAPASVGSTIVLSDSQANRPQPSTRNQVSTLLAATSTALTMADNALFTSSTGAASSSYAYGSAFIYKTDNNAVIQAALNSAHNTYPGGANIALPAGICATSGPLTFYSGQKISGAGPAATVIALTTSSNSDLFISSQFSSYTGTGSFGGLYGNVFEDIGLYGNKAANSGSGIGTNIGTGDGIRMFGYAFDFRNVWIMNFAADGLYTEWGGSASPGDPLNYMVGENLWMNGPMEIENNNGYAWAFAGPHDGQIQNIMITNNNTGGIFQGPNTAGSNSSPITVNHVHGYQNAGFDMTCQFQCTLINDYFEGNTQLSSGFGFQVVGSILGTLTLGATTTSTAAFNVQMAGSQVNTLVNNSGSGFNDRWVGSNLGAVSTASGTGTYTPNYSSATEGMNTYVSAFGQPLVFRNSAAFPAALQVNPSSVFSITQGVNVGVTSGTALTISGDNVGLGHIGGIITSPDAVGVYGALGLEATTSTKPINGIYLPTASANNLRLTTSGADALAITTTGSVGIGTTTPLQAMDVRGLATANGVISNGTTFTIASGCGGVASLTGGATAGSFSAGQAACAPVINLPTAPHGWLCGAKDITTPADTFTQTASTASSCTVSSTVTTADVILFHADGY